MTRRIEASGVPAPVVLLKMKRELKECADSETVLVAGAEPRFQDDAKAFVRVNGAEMIEEEIGSEFCCLTRKTPLDRAEACG